MRSEARQGVRVIRQRFGACQGPFRGIEDALFAQTRENRLAARQQRGSFVDASQQVRGGVGDGRQGRALAPGEIFRGGSVPAPGGGFQPHHVAAERSVGRPQGEDRLLAIPPLEPQGEPGLREFRQEGPTRRRAARTAQHAGHLHGEGGGSLDAAVRSGIVVHGAEDRQRIDSGVDEESLVLGGEDRLAEPERDRVGLRKPPLSVGCCRGAQEPSMEVEDRGGAVFREIARRAQQEDADREARDDEKEASPSRRGASWRARRCHRDVIVDHPEGWVACKVAS